MTTPSAVDALAQFIRTVDGDHSLGAGALAEKICEWQSRQPVSDAEVSALEGRLRKQAVMLNERKFTGPYGLYCVACGNYDGHLESCSFKIAAEMQSAAVDAIALLRRRTAGAEQTYWMIERKIDGQFTGEWLGFHLMNREGFHAGWTKDPQAAFHFCRSIDAHHAASVMVWAKDGPDYGVTEHQDLPAPPAAGAAP